MLSLWPLFLSFVLLGAFLSAFVFGAYPWLFGGLFVASLIAVAIYWRKGLRRVESFFRGARGEERVASVLADLPEGYHVFHDFEAGHERVDHVVAGPTGVFAIETKNWNGRVQIEDGHILVNGALPTRDPAAQAQREADRVSVRLKGLGFEVTVFPVVCFASDTFEPGASANVGAVRVINAGAIAEWLKALPESISQNDLKRLVQLMGTGK